MLPRPEVLRPRASFVATLQFERAEPKIDRMGRPVGAVLSQDIDGISRGALGNSDVDVPIFAEATDLVPLAAGDVLVSISSDEVMSGDLECVVTLSR